MKRLRPVYRFGIVTIALGLGGISPAAEAAGPSTYYIDAEKGDDGHEGTSPDQAWRTVDAIIGRHFEAGTRILFHADQTFNGTLYFNPKNTAGKPGNPVTLGSYGEGRATITSGAEIGLYVHNVGNIRVENLNFLGSVDKETCKSGGFEGSHGIMLRNDSKENISGLTLQQLEITGYCTGILGTAWEEGVPGKLQDVAVSHVSVHDNHAAGILIMGNNTASGGGYTLGDISVSHAVVYNHPGVEPAKEPGANLSGSAIFVYEAEDVMLEHNIAFDNGGENDCIDGGKTGGGPAAIWAYGRNITIQHNEVFHQRTSPQCPWDGIALNGNGSNVLIQYNYTHDNDGLSILQDNRPGQSNNTVRYNISENDCQASNNQGMIMVTGDGENFHIYNNTIVTSRKSGSVGPMVYLGPDNDHGKGRMKNVSFRNNVFVSDNKGPMLMAYGTDRVDGLRFENNVYYNPNGRYQIDWNGTIYNSLEKWSEQTGQETDGKQAFWRAIDPGVCALYSGGTIYPNPLENLTAYRLSMDSPLINTGWDLLRRYGIDMGKRDFFGNPPWTGATPDVGAHEFQDGQECK